MPPPHPRNPNPLNVELLEDRCPASTTLDWLLADLWLSPVATADPLASPTSSRTEASRDDLPATKARHPGQIDDRLETVPLRGDQAAEATRQTRQPRSGPSRDPVGLPIGIDLGFDLPFRGVPVTVVLAAQTATGAGSLAVIAVESPTNGTPGTVVPVVGAAAPVAIEDDPEATFVAASMLLADPTISLTPSTNFIPVNANRTSQSPWKKDAANNDRTGLPVVRDFDLNPMRDLSGWNGLNLPPPGPAIADPELKQMTATVANPGNPTGPIQVFVIYSDADNNGGGKIWLWRNQTKENSIPLTYQGNGVYHGSLPDFPTSTFYVEGIRPSKQANDVKLRVTYQAGMPGPGQPPPPLTTDETTLTVTPVVKEFNVTPKEGGQVTFLRNLQGQIVGLNSGTQAQNGGWPDGTDIHPNDLSGAGAVFFAVVEPRTGIEGTPEFLQTIVVTNGDPSGVSLSGFGDFNMGLDGEIFPILDTFPTLVPFYESLKGPNNSDKVQMTAKDSPIVVEKELYNTSGWANLITRMDVTYTFRLHLVWHFPDRTIFSLAKVDWQVVFRTADLDPIIVSPDSVITANPFELNNLNPARVLGPVFGEKFGWFASAG